MPTVKFINEKKSIEVPEGAILRTEGLKNGIEMHPYPRNLWFANCHGFGHCGSCVVNIVKGQENVSKQGFMERMRMLLGPLLFFMRLGREKNVRLACQTKVLGDIEVETQAQVNWHGEKFWG